MEAILFRESHDLFAGFFLLEETHFIRLDAHNNVVKNREALDKFEMLMHHADAKSICVIRVVDFYFNTVFFDDTFFRLIKAEQHTHQCALARAIFSQKCMDFAFFELKGDVIVCNDPGELFGNVQHFYSILFQSRPASFSKESDVRWNQVRL